MRCRWTNPVTSLVVHAGAGYRRPMQARSPARIALMAAVAAALSLTAGCSMFGGGSGPSETGYVARDAESLYTAAKQRLDSGDARVAARSEEHTSELQSRENLVCRLLLEKKKNKKSI